MSEAIYSAVAYAMRYWYVLLFALMLLGLILVSVKEFREKKRVLTEVGRFIGYIEVTDGPEEMLGVRVGLTPENTIGSGSRADILLNDPSVAKTHAMIYTDGNRMILTPMGDGVTMVNGRRTTRPRVIATGDMIRFGDIEVEVCRRERSDEDDD